MSPEQASGEQEVNQQSDVFSLGATLYCILTGRAPHADDDPSKTLDNAKSGQVTPPQVINECVPKALASIAMKAMQTSVDSRYQTAREMARDIENWIADEKVSAYQEPILERAFRWSRRHRAWAISALSALMLIATVSSLFSIMLVRQNRIIAEQETIALGLAKQNQILAEQERDAKVLAIQQRSLAERHQQDAENALAHYQAALDYLVDAFRSPDPRRSGEAITVVDVLRQAEASLEEHFKEAPLAKATMLDTLARTYAGLRLFPQVLPVAKAAYKLRSEILAPTHADVIKSKSLLGQAYFFDGQPEKAKQVIEESLQLTKQHLGKDNLLVFVCQNDLATVHRALGNLEKSIDIGESNLAHAKESLGDANPRTLRYLLNLATSYHQFGRSGRALSLGEKTKMLRQTLGKHHPTTIAAEKGLAKIYLEVGKFSDAVNLLQDILQVEKDILDKDHFVLLSTMAHLGEARRAAGDTESAIAILEQVVKTDDRSRRPEYQIFDAYAFLGKAYSDAQHFDKAIAEFERALEISRAEFGDRADTTIAILSSRASILHRLDRAEEALRSHLEAYEIATAKPESHPLRATLANNLAMAYSRLGKPADAIPLWESAIRVLEERQGSLAIRLPMMKNLADAYRKSGRLDEAIALHRETRELKVKHFAANHPSTIKSSLSLLSAYQEKGLVDEANHLIETTDAKLPLGHPVSFAFKNNAGKFYSFQQNWPKAIEFAEAAKKLSDTFHGPENKHSLRSLRNWATCLHRAGDSEAALAKFNELADLQRRAFDAYHPDARRTIRTIARIHFSEQQFSEVRPWEAKIADGINDQMSASERVEAWQIIAESCLHDNRLDQAVSAMKKKRRPSQ